MTWPSAAAQVVKSRFSRLDRHMQEVVRGALLAFTIKALGAGLAFAFNVAIGRLLGPEGTGLYFLALSVTVIGSVIGRLGLDNTLLRFTSVYATKNEWGKVQGAYALGMRIAILAAGTLSLLGFCFGPFIATLVFSKPSFAEPLRWMSLSILPYSIFNLQAESLKGLKCIREAMLVQGVGLPLFGLCLIWPLTKTAGVKGATWAYLLAAMLVAFLGYWAWQRAMTGKREKVVNTFPFVHLWSSCKPLFITSLMVRGVLPWAPLFMLGTFATSDQVGIYGAANRVAMLLSFMLLAVNNVLAPKFAELYAKGEFDALGSTARRSALMVTLLASPIFLFLIIGGKLVMALFGPGFTEGATVLAILAIGQFFNTITGSVNHFLIVTGNEAIVRNTFVIAALTQVAIGLALIPWWGMLGAAIASSIATAGVNVAAAYAVWKKIGIITVPFLREHRER